MTISDVLSKFAMGFLSDSDRVDVINSITAIVQNLPLIKTHGYQAGVIL